MLDQRPRRWTIKERLDQRPRRWAVKERLDADGALERQCSKCLEWWPADQEFFYTTGSNGDLRTDCKACHQERRNGKRRLQRAERRSH